MWSVDGIHDMGGMQGFGRIPVAPEEAVFHAPWEARVHAMVYLLIGAGVSNVDAFRHAIEQIPPAEYLTVGYYGRWLRAAETLVAQAGRADAKPADASSAGLFHDFRDLPTEPRFAIGAPVRVRNLHPSGHTRLPGYVRGKRGVIGRVHRACVLPDTNAHGRGERLEHLFSVRFSASELWGDGAESDAPVCVDLFDRYLETPPGPEEG